MIFVVLEAAAWTLSRFVEMATLARSREEGQWGSNIFNKMSPYLLLQGADSTWVKDASHSRRLWSLEFWTRLGHGPQGQHWLQQAHKDEGCQRESGPGSRMSKFWHCSQSDERVLPHLQADLSRCVQSRLSTIFALRWLTVPGARTSPSHDRRRE
jgi:hypothetical protein